MKKYKVGIYLRLSDEDKDKKFDNSESIKNQRHMLINEINNHEDFVFYDEYCDEDLSGAGTFRPEFERLIKDCEQGNIDIVMCKSQSRFSRDMEIIEKYLHNKFIEWNIRFISLSDYADTNNLGNKKARQINGLVNEWYLEDVSNNIRSAFNIKMRQGEFISPFAPFGYQISKYDNNKLIIDPYASIIVKKIFKLFLNGYSYTLIANTLNEKNIPSPSYYKYQSGIKLNINSSKNRSDIKWSPNSIKTILKNEIYTGSLIQGKRTTISYKNHKIKNKNKNEWIKVENTHEPIIDNNTFNKVQNLIKSKYKPLKKTQLKHIFSNTIYCHNCKKLMRKKNSNKHTYLVCYNNNCSNKKGIRYDELEKIILDKINNLINNYYDESLINDSQLTIKETKTNKLENKLKENETLLKQLYEDKINNKINNEIFNIISNFYIKDINFIKKQITYIENKKRNINNNIPCKKFNKLNKLIVNEFIDKIYISSVNNNQRIVEINWNF